MKKIAIGALAVVLVLAAVTYMAQPMMFGPPDGKTLTDAEKSECGITAKVTEGPYFVSGTRALVNGNLNYDNLMGTPIAVSGHVYQGLDNAKPLANAKVEIWHTDSSGAYHPNGNGPTTSYQPHEITLRGYVLTDAQGAYRFTSIYPGEYAGRTRHIHIKVTPEGGQTMTSQLIIPSLTGDALTFDEDTVSKGLPTCHVLSFDKSKSPEEAVFDFRLK
jgi:protocatechuate 3,4-dioxygenase beta subunit